MAAPGAVLVVGVGPGLGASIGRRFAKAGHPVVLGSRHPDKLQPIVQDIQKLGGKAEAHMCDATDKADLKGLTALIEQDIAPLEVAIYNAGAWGRWSLVDTNAADYERMWRVNAYGGFIVGREAARRMLRRGRGTILFTGATASMRGGDGFAAFAGGKFALRALAQSMARELGPKGIHVAHIIIDGQIGKDAKGAKLDPDAIADTYCMLHGQPRNAWTHELDLRPSAEKF